MAAQRGLLRAGAPGQRGPTTAFAARRADPADEAAAPAYGVHGAQGVWTSIALTGAAGHGHAWKLEDHAHRGLTFRCCIAHASQQLDSLGHLGSMIGLPTDA